MKKLLLILFLILTLCACGLQEEPVLEEPSENNSIGADIIRPEEPEIFEEKEKTEDEIYYESLDQEGKNMYTHINEKAIDWNSGTKILASEYGIGTSFKNIRFIDDWYYSAVLVLQKYGTENTVEIPVTGVYYHSEFYGSREAPFGGFCYPGNGKVYFCGLEKIVEIDPENLTAKELELDFPEKDFDDLWINGIFVSNSIYINATGIDKKSPEESDGYLWTYDREGNFVSEIITENFYCTGFDDVVFPAFARETETIEREGKIYLLRTGTRYAVNAKTGKAFYFSDAITLSSGNYKLELIYYYPSDKDYYEGQYLVTFLKNAELVGEMIFDNKDFVTATNMEEAKPRLEISKDGKIATYICDYFAMSVDFDFEKGTANLEFNPTDKNIDDQNYYIDPINSADGKYSIHSFGYYGGGDVMYSLLTLRNNKTGEHKYIGKIGGMYGGTCGSGFLKNNDAYVFSTSMLNIFDPETGEIKFNLGKHIPLGYDSKEDSERGLLTFRRNPEDFTYIIVYYEYENGFEWDENYNANCNYKIGFLDPKGNLIESYDTGCAMRGSPFGICPIDMRYSENELKFFGTGGKGGTNLEAVFDMETKEFTAITQN